MLLRLSLLLVFLFMPGKECLRKSFGGPLSRRLYAFEGDKPLNMILDDGGDLTNIVLDKNPDLNSGY